MDIREIFKVFEEVALPASASPWDRCGVQVAGTLAETKTIALALDPTPDTIARALEKGAGCILTHHPLALHPRFLNAVDDYHRVASLLLGAKAWLYATHTSLDANPEGPAGWLARELGMDDVDILEPTLTIRPMAVLFDLSGGDPAALVALEAMDGVLDVSQDDSGEVMLVCRSNVWTSLRGRIGDLLGFSPVFMMAELSLPDHVYGLGFVGDLPQPMTWDAFSARLSSAVRRDFWTLAGTSPSLVQRVAYCTGSGSSLVSQAFAQGADVYITGEVKHHDAIAAPGCIIDVGHFCLEEEMMRRFAADLREHPALSSVTIEFLDGTDPQRVFTPAG